MLTLQELQAKQAAVRRLASIIHNNGRCDRYGKPKSPGYDAMYIVTPEGERLPLNAARSRANG